MNKKPNILLLVSDHHRGDWMPYPDEVREKLGVKNLPITMPNVMKLMDEGVSFTNCITPSPLCAPARACLASGLNYQNCGVKDNSENYPVTQKTFYSVLKEAGYNVGGVGKFDLHKPVHFWGLDGWVDDLGRMGFTHAIDNEGKMDGHHSGKTEPKGPYLKYLYKNNLQDIHIKDFDRRKAIKHDTEPTELPEEAYCDNWLSNNGINMIRRFDENKPWFLQVNFTGPHGPWDVTKRMKDRWKDVEFPQPVGNDTVKPQKHNEVRQNFAAMIENIDRNIGLLINEVEKRGELDNTIIIYTADHGDMLGDKNLFGKCVPYRGSVSIPLVVWGNGIKKGLLSEIMVELQDLTSTITDFCGLDMPEAKDSKSLKNYLTGYDNKPIREYQTSALWEWKMITDGKTKTIYSDGKMAEIYNLTEDAWELKNNKTDFFNVAKVKGRWTLIDPNGKPFYTIGLNHTEETNLKDLSNIHVWEKKYGSRENWITNGVVKDLIDWNFNTIGWTQDNVVGSVKPMRGCMHSYGWTYNDYIQSNMPYCVNLEIADIACWDLNANFPDVFSSEFDDWCTYLARKVCTEHKNSKNLIGYFLVDIPAWTTHKTGRTFPQLKGLEVESQEYIEKRKEIAERYYSVATKHIRNYDPNHLILGDRFNGNHQSFDDVYKIAEKYVDVISIQYFGQGTKESHIRMEEHFDKVYELTGKPLLLADIGNSCPTELNPINALNNSLKNQKDRADDYIASISRLADKKYLIGWHWCAHIENTARGWGIKNNMDEPYLDFLEPVSNYNKKTKNEHLEYFKKEE